MPDGKVVQAIGVAGDKVGLQINEVAARAAWFASVTTPFESDVAAEPAVVVTAPVNAGNALAGSEVALLRLIPVGVPVALVSTSVDGVPKLGVTSVGDVASTTAEPALPVVFVATICELLFDPNTAADAGTLGIWLKSCVTS